MNVFDINGRVAVITGGNRGLGRGIARGFAQAGAHVAVIGSSATDACLAELQPYGGKYRAYAFDLSGAEGYEELLQSILQDFGTVDILVNNAGVQRRHQAEQFPEEDWDVVLSVNLDAVFRMCRKFGAHMLQNEKGKIINMASLLSFQGGLTVPAYAAAKSAVVGLTRALSNEWASRGICVNAIAPGYMDTDMNAAIKSNEARNRQIMERIPAGRWGRAEDLVGASIFLASDASNYVSGHTLVVDGGWMGR